MKKIKIDVPPPQRHYGAVVYWITVSSALLCIAGLPFAVLAPGGNVLDPHLVFSGIWEGLSAAEVWERAGQGFPGGHFYIKSLPRGDSLIQFGIALGSTAALWGCIAASAGYLREKSYGYAAACLFVAAFIIFAMTGVVSPG